MDKTKTEKFNDFVKKHHVKFAIGALYTALIVETCIVYSYRGRMIQVKKTNAKYMLWLDQDEMFLRKMNLVDDFDQFIDSLNK